MPKSRKSQISLQDTPYYHCVTRCVRRAFLCGEDRVTGISYEHRRQWVEDKLLSLAQVFCIDICAYAVMSNHTHVVLCVDRDQALALSELEVLQRWHSMHKGTLLTQRFADDSERINMDAAEVLTVRATIELYRKRLFDISWFMRHLNEHIAREANKEDGCTGRFWEGRFKSQALLDEAALAACMAYVDLNPIRAKLADTPESSAHTSVQKRAHAATNKKPQPKQLLKFAGNPRRNMPKGLPFRLVDYLALVDETGRTIRKGKMGYTDSEQWQILKRLNIAPGSWLTITTEFEQQFSYPAGDRIHIKAYRQHAEHQRPRGMHQACRLLANKWHG